MKTRYTKIKVFSLLIILLISSVGFTSCVDKDVRKSKKVAKVRHQKKKNHVSKHKNHKKLAH